MYVSPSVLFHQSHTSSSLFYSQNIARVHPRRPCDLANSFFSIVGLVLRPSHVRNTLEPSMAVTHVLFVDDESRGDSIFQFACFLFHVIELSFHKFLFLARPSFIFNTSRFSFTASSCPIFLVVCCRVLRKESTHKERKQKERKHEDIFQSFCEVFEISFVILLLLMSILFEKDFLKRLCLTKMEKTVS